MDKETLLANLADLRRINFALWKDYFRDAKKQPGWRSEFRDDYEMKVRTLDYVMEAIRRNDII